MPIRIVAPAALKPSEKPPPPQQRSATLIPEENYNASEGARMGQESRTWGGIGTVVGRKKDPRAGGDSELAGSRHETL